VTSGSSPWNEEFTEAGIEVMQVRFLGQRFPIPLLNPIRIVRLFREADVVQVMGFWFLLAAVCCAIALVAGTPLVLCPAGSLSRYARNSTLKRFYFAAVGRYMIRSAATIVATTEQEKLLLISDFHVAPESILISPNGIAPYESGSPFEFEQKERFILFLGRLTAIKAPDLLLEAFVQVAVAIPDVSLVIAGPDLGLRAQLEERVAQLRLESRVRFTGYVNEEQRTALLGKASLLVVPSHSEVMSMVALEAGAMGVPVVLTDQCGFDDVAKIGGGLVVEVDRAALADAIVRMMSDDNALKASGARLRAFVLENYAWQKVASRLLDHFRMLSPTR
jgi:glycosyltransferase involved in cell wall biosynthesis